MTTADMQDVVTPADSRNGEAGRLCVQRLVRRRSMCEECPFRGKDRATQIAMALVDGFSCHMEDGPEGIGESASGIQCRGHWEAKRKTQ